jgi:nicotinate phosphoribosyltransferase
MEQAAIEKAHKMKENGIVFSLFGMRRRFSFDVEDRVTELLKQNAGNSFFGTSNVYLAFKHNVNISGTHPHEWVQFHGRYTDIRWPIYVDGRLDQRLRWRFGNVLTDTYTTDVFYEISVKSMLHFSQSSSGQRRPFLFTDKVIKRYEELKVIQN